MSSIKSIKNVADILSAEEIQNLTTTDFHQIENLLKDKQKQDSNVDAVAIQSFLKLAKEQPKGVLFLLKNQNIIHILTRRFAKMEERVKLDVQGFDADEIKAFMEERLSDDFTDAITYYFNKGLYQPITKLLTYRKIVPDSFLDLIRTKADQKVDFLMNKIDEIYHKDPIYKESFFIMTETLDDAAITEKINHMQSLSIKYSLDIVNTPGRGIFAFFKIVGKGIHWLSNEPKTPQEKIERKMAMEDFKFMSYFFIGFIVIIGIAIGYTLSSKSAEKEARKEVANQAFTESMRGFLTEFNPAKARNIIYVDSLYKSGDNPYAKEYIRGARGKNIVTTTKQFINTTEFDIIVISYDELVLAFGQQPYRYLIKSGDTLEGMHSVANHYYIGKELALFNSNEKYIPKRYNAAKPAPRFLKPYKNVRAIIQLTIESSGNIKFTQQGDDIYINSDQSFFVNGAPKKSHKF